MDFLSQFAHNEFIVITFLAWFVAQLIKFFTTLVITGKPNFGKLISSGGMPSSHSSSVCALATSVGMKLGFDSAAFAICFVFGFIVMYDAAGVRLETGKQAIILNRIVNDLMENKPVYFQKELKELIGHTPIEVLVGAILGVTMSVAVLPLMNI